jgi:hypothetical protein
MAFDISSVVFLGDYGHVLVMWQGKISAMQALLLAILDVW